MTLLPAITGATYSLPAILRIRPATKRHRVVAEQAQGRGSFVTDFMPFVNGMNQGISESPGFGTVAVITRKRQEVILTQSAGMAIPPAP